MFALANHVSRHRKGVRGFLVELSIILSITSSTIFSGPFVQNVYGATATQGTVTARSGFVRQEASTSSAVVFCVQKDENVAILGKGKDKSGTTWYKISVGDQVGYIRSDLVKSTDKKITVDDSLVADSSSQASSDTAKSTTTTNSTSSSTSTTSTTSTGTLGVINGTSVRLRSSASTSSSMVKYLDLGQLVSILNEGKASDGNVWYQTNARGDIGFVRSDLVNKIGSESTSSSTTDNSASTSENTNAEATEDTSKSENLTPATVEASSGTQAVIKGSAVRIRTAPSTGSVVCQLSNGHPIVIEGEEDASDGYKWYKVSFSYMGNAKNGYVRSDLVTGVEGVSTEVAEVSDSEFESMISSFPESYKNSLRLLHKSHPTWRFEAVNTGLEWSAALAAESSVGKNLVAKNSVASWKSTATQAYNAETNTWYTFDGGSWVSASSELIAFYMDPRNFLNDNGIFQFAVLDYDENHTADKVGKILSGTFMNGSFTDTDGATLNYADLFALCGSVAGVSPYLLADRAVQEQGIRGTSQSISGTVSGYAGYFNYYNIGAYAYGGRTATINGLIYAMGNDESSLRPWNTRARSIYGGAKYIADNYVKKGQNTLYFQKFNVINADNKLYSHQYMSNIQAAASESARLQLAYAGSNDSVTFKIPVYNNMPVVASIKPTSDASPNAYLSALVVDGYDILPAFSGAIEDYVLSVPESTETVTVNALPVSDKSAVAGVGTYNINRGENKIYITCKSQNGSVKRYSVTVYRQ